MEEKDLALEQPAEHRVSAWEWGSRILSGVFHPMLLPFYVFLLLFHYTYLAIMPLQYRWFVLGAVHHPYKDLPCFHYPHTLSGSV